MSRAAACRRRRVLGRAGWARVVAAALLVACTPDVPERRAPEAAPPVEAVSLPAAPVPVQIPEPAQPAHPVNVILISIDTLRADHLSAYGYARQTSPAIDALAASGIRFQHAYSHSPKTTPSHMSLFTSLYPEVHQVQNRTGLETDARLSRGIPTLPMLLHGAGYRTAAFTNGGNVDREIGFGRGFERYEHMPIEAAATFEAGSETLRHWAAEDSAAEGGDRPFFLFLHTAEVHDPYLPPASHRTLFSDPAYSGGVVSDRTRLSQLADAAGRSLPSEFWQHVRLDDPADVQHLRDLYDACIRTTDDAVRGLLATVDALGLRDDTAIVLVADHGEEFLEHGGTRHESLFDELLHVPLIVRLPARAAAEIGVPPGQVVDATVRLVDVTPTLLDLVGLPIPAHLQGSSLLPLLRASAPGTAAESAESEPRYVFAHWRESGFRSLRIGRYKIIRIKNALHVFDLQTDPNERRPLELRRPDLVAVLSRKLKQLVDVSHATAELVAPGEAAPLDEETRARLRALGYLE